MKAKRTFLLIFLLLAAIVFGAWIAAVCAGIPGLNWLAFSRSIGISPNAPLVLDLSVVHFSFGFAIDISLAQVVIMGLAIALYSVLKKNIK